MPALHQSPVHRPVPQPEWLSLKEAVELGYGGYSTLRKRIAEGQLLASKINGRIKMRQEDLDALVTPTRRQEQSFEDVESAVERIVATAPPLTDDQVRRIASLLGGAS